jgi:hypothetical protein
VSVRRIGLLVVLAALVPVSAFALDGTGTPAGPSGMSVSAALGGCGVASDQVYCSIDVTFSGVPGADYYTASVTRADGSVQGFGQVATGSSGGGASLWVPYVGAGTYGVRVSAYGTPPGEADDGHPELLDRDRAGTGGFKPVPDGRQRTGTVRGGPSATQTRPSARPDRPLADNGTPSRPPEASPPPAPEPAPLEPAQPQTETETVAPPPTVTLPECQPQPAPAPAPSEDPDDAPTEAAPPAPAPPPIVECTTPSSDAQGSCCPPGA